MSGFLSIAISVISGFLIIGAILVILNDNQDSGRKIAWILTIGILPVVGLLLYIAFGLNFRKPGIFQKRNRKFLETFESRTGCSTKELLFGDAQEHQTGIPQP